MFAVVVDIGQHGVERNRTLSFKFRDVSLQAGDGVLEGGGRRANGIENIRARGEGGSAIRGSGSRWLHEVTVGR